MRSVYLIYILLSASSASRDNMPRSTPRVMGHSIGGDFARAYHRARLGIAEPGQFP